MMLGGNTPHTNSNYEQFENQMRMFQGRNGRN